MTLAPDPARDPLRGVWVGMALGDALGSAHAGRPETWPVGSLVDLVGGGPDRLPAGAFGAWTSLALAVAEGVVLRGGYHRETHEAQLQRWWRGGRWSVLGHAFGSAPATRAWLASRGLRGVDVTTPARDDDALAAALGPASFLRALPEVAVRTAAEAVATVRVEAGPVGATLGAGLLEALGGEPSRPGREPGAGLVARAARVLEGADDFEGALVAMVGHPDVDGALGAVVGALAGARHGVRAIPVRWRAQLAWGPEIVALADQLVDGPVAGPRSVRHPGRPWARSSVVGRR